MEDIFMKKVRAVIVCLMAMVMLTGCLGLNMEMTVNEDGTCGYTLTYYYEQSTFELMKEDAKNSVLTCGDFAQDTKTINGKTYQAFSKTFSFASREELKNFLTNDAVYLAKFKQDSKAADKYTADSFHAPFKNVTLTADTFIGEAGTNNYTSMSTKQAQASKTQNNARALDVAQVSSQLKGKSVNEYYKALGLIMDISIVLPKPIKESNGAAEGNKVTWNLDNLPDDSKLIATCGDTPIISGDKETPKIQGVRNNALTKKAVLVKVTDNVSVKEVTINGKRFNVSQFKLAKSGRYTIKAVDANGNVSVLKFTIDAKAPVFKGVRHGKVYRKKVTVKVSDANGIRYIKVNGKKQKARKKLVIRKKGKNTVIACDKAGNQSKVVFTIK